MIAEDPEARRERRSTGASALAGKPSAQMATATAAHRIVTGKFALVRLHSECCQDPSAGFFEILQLLFQIGDSRGSGFDVFGRLFFALLELVDFRLRFVGALLGRFNSLVSRIFATIG